MKLRIRKTRRQRGGQKKPIIILQTRWGFGNQIIQYCVACAVQKKFGYEMFILPPLDNVHSNNRDFRDFFVRGKKIEKIPDDFLDPHLTMGSTNIMLNTSKIPEGKNIMLDSLGHHYEPFEHIMPELGKEMHKTLKKLYPDLQIKDSVKNGFIHVRRGDIAGTGWDQSFDYFKKGLEIANTKSSVETWYIFSDDIKWCKEQLWDKTKKIVFIDEDNEIKALALMSKCIGGAIIGQSTFAWAGVMSGANNNKKSFIIANMHLITHGQGEKKHKYVGPSHWSYLNNTGKEYAYNR